MTKIPLLVVDAQLRLFLEAESALHSYQVRFHEYSTEVVFEVDFARSPEEARKHLNQPEKSYAVVLLTHSTKTPATEMLAEVRAIDSEALTIIVADDATLEEALSLTRAGAFEFLVRPLHGEDLRSTMKKAARHVLAHRRAMNLEEERKRMRFQFISVLAHELKSPIAAVEGYLELMREGALGEHIADYQDSIRRSILRISGMRRLILDLLDLTRLESGQMKTQPETVAIHEVIDETLDVLRDDLERRGIQLSCTVNKDLTFWADRQHLLIVCNNLLSNAVKYNVDNGSIDFSAHLAGERLRLTCSDTGLGMSATDVQKLFGEFVRIRTEETRKIPGSGLGLSILKKVTQIYRGTIQVESELGKGSRFVVELGEFKPNQPV